MIAHDLVRALDGIGRPRILVLGDLMLDRYSWGNAQRISDEAPVVVLRVDRREERPGGAANVVNMLAALDCAVTSCGVVGDDSAGGRLRHLLVDRGANCEGVVVDRRRPTTEKERFFGRANGRHASQVLRVDQEDCRPLEPPLESQLIAALVAHMAQHDALLISDYGKGACTPRVLAASIAAAREAHIPVVVDPSRNCPLSCYRGVTAIKPNRVETQLATSCRIARPGDAVEAGRQLCNELDADMALITLDSDGMVLVTRQGAADTFSTHARAVYDITGAGDMVLSMFGMCLAAGVAPADAVRLGNVAAGIEVERTGVDVVYRHEIRAELLSQRGGAARKIVTLEQAQLLAEEHRRRGQRTVFTNGCFDLLHVGHVTYLGEAASLGDILFVGVNSDQSVSKLKGPARPVIGQADRAAMLAALGCVDYVIVFDHDTPHALLEAIRPDVLVKGGTYTTAQVVGHEIVEGYGGTVCVTGVVDGISTTGILASLARGDGPSAPPSAQEQKSQSPLPRLRRAG